MYYQQGDVLIERVAEEAFPQGRPLAPKEGSFILQHGEATGHCHRIAAESVTAIRSAGFIYFQNLAPVVLRHEEHGPIELPPGSYRVRRVREYDHFSEQARVVLD